MAVYLPSVEAWRLLIYLALRCWGWRNWGKEKDRENIKKKLANKEEIDGERKERKRHEEVVVVLMKLGILAFDGAFY